MYSESVGDPVRGLEEVLRVVKTDGIWHEIVACPVSERGARRTRRR